MSYYISTTEEIKINNCNDKTAFVVKMLAKYIQSFDAVYRIVSYKIDDARLIVNDEEINLGKFSYDGKKFFSEVTRGKNKGKLAPLGSRPSPFYNMLNWANFTSNRENSISFRISYGCSGYAGSDMGYAYWYDFLNAFDCEEIRNNVEYRCLETCGGDPDGAYFFKYGKNGPDPVSSEKSLERIRPGSKWDADCYATICYYDKNNERILAKEDAEKIIEEISPLLKKYNLTMADYEENCGSIDIEGYAYLDGAALPTFLEDVQKLLNIIKPYGLDFGCYTHYIICYNYDNLGVITLELNEDYALNYHYFKLN